MKKRIVSILLVTVMTVGLLAGCGGSGKKNDTAKGTEKNEVSEVSMMIFEDAEAPFSEDWLVVKTIEEKTGVKLNVQSVPVSDQPTKTQVVLNSGEMPDIMTKTFPKATDALSGLFLPISDYVDKLPNFQKYLKDNELEKYMESQRMADGKYYMLPVKAKTKVIQDHQWIVRKDILDKNNLPMPTTLDELLEVALKLKEIYPESTPISNRFKSDNIMAGLASAFDSIAGWALGEGMFYDEKEDKWIFSPTTDNWKQFIEYARELYSSGALDSEFSTQDSSVYAQRIAKGEIFIAYDWATNCKKFNQDGVQYDEDFNMVAMAPPEGLKNEYALQWNAPWEQAWVMSATVAEKDNFDDILKMIDWMYSDEAMTAMTFGEEGVTYKVEDGKKVFMDETVKYNSDYGLLENNFCVRLDIEYYASMLPQETLDVYEVCADNGYVPPTNPASPLTAEQIDELSVTSSTLVDYVKSMMESFIFGTESLDNWEKFVKECENKGSTKMEEMYNEAWAARGK